MTDFSLQHTNHYDEERATFGDRLAAARQAHGLDQKSLAKCLGVLVSTIKAWELDRREPASNRLQMLAGLLNVSIVWLLTGAGIGVPEPSDKQVNAAHARTLAREVKSLKDDFVTSSARLERLEKHIQRLL